MDRTRRAMGGPKTFDAVRQHLLPRLVGSVEEGRRSDEAQLASMRKGDTFRFSPVPVTLAAPVQSYLATYLMHDWIMLVARGCAEPDATPVVIDAREILPGSIIRVFPVVRPWTGGGA